MKFLLNISITIPMIVFGILATYCSNEQLQKNEDLDLPLPSTFYKGADLSYVNEMEDCGAIFLDNDGNTQSPFTTIANAGGNLVRVRLWNDPTDFTNYSTIDDVESTIQRAKDNNLQVLLDFHYSDRWTDPGTQVTPKAWASVQNNSTKLGDSLFKYTYQVLKRLNTKNLLPNIVQVGNEINTEILQAKDGQGLIINWERNSALINRGISAVRKASKDFNTPIEIMLHVAQPENALFWFKAASDNGIVDYDWIGVSYYPANSTFKLNNTEAYENLGNAIRLLREAHEKQVMIVETAYAFTLENFDEASNILSTDSLIDSYSATQQGQLNFLNRLVEVVEDAGGAGVVYWEPAWVATNCTTLFGTGSNWDNATLYDGSGKPTLGMNFFNIK